MEQHSPSLALSRRPNRRSSRPGESSNIDVPFHAGMQRLYPFIPSPQEWILTASFTGGSEGLEFVFDVCAPTRPVRGPHYVVSRQYHKRLNMRQLERAEPIFSWPEPIIREELLRLYFHHVHPFLPVVDAHNVLQRYEHGVDSISRLLLWSMFFAAANFVSAEFLTMMAISSRKSLREYFYQRAKETYDAQEESDKTTIIQSTILLSFWFADREDLDGSWHWLGITISLCHTIGLHRAPNPEYIAQSPFTLSQRAAWKRIWWCCFSREAFAAQGFGRPMRINPDDCDVEMPTVNDILLGFQVIHRR